MNGRKKTPLSSEAIIFKRFLSAAITFVLGMSAIVYVNLVLPASKEQELIALIGLVLSIPSGILAFYFYLRLLWSRFENFSKK